MPDEMPKRFDESEAIRHLEKNLYRYPYQIFEESPKGFNLSQATHMRQEVQYVADSIMKLVMSQGYSYKDISVVTGDLSGYENAFRQIFNAYDIPFFMDQKKTIMSHPMVQLLLAAMDVISKDFSYESIFRYLKSGLLETKGKTLDALENYVLAYGIRGLKTWQQKWERPYPLWKGDPEAEHTKKMLDEMNRLKEGLLDPLIQFKKDLKKESPTVASTTKAVFNWMRTLRLEEKMTEQEVIFEKQGNLLYQKEYSQIYKMIVDVLDQTVEILGDSAIVLKEYANLLQAGLEECEMGLVPPGLDQVVIGDLERTRLKEVKALFVVGFNEGKIPKKVSDANILTDYERQQLKALGIALAPDNKENIFKEQFSLYMGLLRVSKKLYLSYAKSDLQGKPMRPSLLFYTIKKMYPKINVLDLEEIYRNRLIVNRPKPTFQHLIGNQRSANEIGEKDENVQAYRWFMAQEVWRPVVLALQETSKVSNHESALSPEMVEFLYGKELKNSVSRLETYARCPFAHFIDYGLHLRERLDYTVKMPDIGILFHRAIDLCSRKIDHRGFDWKTLEASVRDELVEQSVLEVVG
ncbi:MAG: exodeoxyribonuclease V subunit gamma, partial [Vallitaleaceae bacterium]|nr:exodeoxyribonuclease V subunit gamma [Vallitaleaceae bacterium]